ncbi:IMPACT family protein [Kineococcus gynurae]|uniref:IMPACT family protein n=1 Tax=Kineococcus gynurae TaxID=452979 RepID=A0ABV5LS74_9ACTN
MTPVRPVLGGPVRSEIVVDRSRFVCDLRAVADEGAAADALSGIHREFHDARHHCSALVLGAHGEVVRSSDDGEPSGTAGAPMLSTLTGSGLTDVLAVVTRWFGGILLGSGGLVRAYSAAVGAALEEAVVVARHEVRLFALEASPAAGGRVESLLRNRFGDRAVEDTRWGAQGWSATLALPVEGPGVEALTEPPFGTSITATELGTAVRPR